MPYAFKANKVFAKNPDGDGYMSQTVITDKTTNDAIAEIQAAGSTQVANVNSAGTTQTTRVNTAGNSQVTAISNKATELQTLMNDADTTISKIDALDDIISGLRSLLDLVHPVGSIYISKDPTDPGDMFGGVWSPITDRFLLTAGSTYHVGDADGGEATHMLTENELPAFTRQISMRKLYTENFANDYTMFVQTGSTDYGTSENHDWKVTIGGIGTDVLGPNGLSGPVVQPAINYKNKPGVTDAATAGAARMTLIFGGDQPHNNMPPYTIVYAWERIQ